MQTFVCIDDTDSLEEKSTGKLAQAIIERIEERGIGECSFITRHQLYFHPAIPYTSHNSAMCFAVEHTDSIYEPLRDLAADLLLNESAEGSDPGLCIVEMEKLKDKGMLMDYGRMAKREILTKELAYETADKLGVHLSEHGGTGGGVIGALAGVGLRLTGSDGRIRGKIKFPSLGNISTVKDILDNSTIDEVRSLEGDLIPEDVKVILGEKIKTVFLDYKEVLLIYKKFDEKTDSYDWHTSIKEQWKNY
jgi:hypothetical protein